MRLNDLIKFITPTQIYKTVFDIHYDKLKNSGIKNLVFDIDNTLFERGKDAPEWKVKKFLRDLKEQGFNILLLSNSSQMKRLTKAVSFLEFPALMMAFKPLPFIYKKLRRDYYLDEKNTIFIGDQLLTDILGANWAGFKAIYVYPLSRETSSYRRGYMAMEQWILKKFILNRDL